MTPSPTKTCRLVTLGCKVNQYETQYVKEMLESVGYQEAPADIPVDLCVVNTCTVTAEGDAKSRQLVRRLHQANPSADIVVMGCYATRDPHTVGQLPGVTQVITNKEHLHEEFRAYGVPVRAGSVSDGFSRISRFDGHQRAFVKVQDGCLLNCSFCIIPSVRPVLRSRSIEEIEAEVSRLVEAGYQEIVLTGIHLGHYGIDLSRGKPRQRWSRLWHLLERLARLPEDFRIRLSSLEAAEARDDLIRALAGHPRICPHLHLCLQSGSDRILARMKRRYRAAGFLERCRRIREQLDTPAFTTDVIVGFPGETDEDFAQTLAVVREVGFSRIHLFSYSPRAGTPAADFTDRVAPALVTQRREQLKQLERSLASQYYRSLLGRTLDVLVEGPAPARPGLVQGTSCRYAPVVCRGHAPALLRKRIPVRAIALAEEGLIGESEPEASATGSFRRTPIPLLAPGE
jgi:threonylcarbamoyladenosine tRNA methylthiotransferase MtaB